MDKLPKFITEPQKPKAAAPTKSTAPIVRGHPQTGSNFSAKKR